MAAKQVAGIWLPDSEQHFAQSPYLGERYPVLDHALRFLPDRRRVAVDVGAHIGLWSRWLVDEFKEVVAFEPVSEYADILRKNVTAKNLRINRFALGAEQGQVSIKKNPEDTGQAYIVGHGHIPMWPLDCFRLSDVDLIKIDVEGYELQVVKGAERTLLTNKPILVIEQRGNEVVNFGAERDCASEWLSQIGMKKLDQVGCDMIFGF